MRKKAVVITISVFVLLFILSFFQSLVPLPWQYVGWQTVSVPDVGTFKVPGNWVITQSDRILYLTDKPMEEDGYVIYFAGTVYNKPGEPYLAPESLLGMTDKSQYSWDSEGLSNSAGFGVREYLLEEESVEKYSIDLFCPPETRMDIIAWDETIERNLVKKIAQSYIMGG